MEFRMNPTKDKCQVLVLEIALGLKENTKTADQWESIWLSQWSKGPWTTYHTEELHRNQTQLILLCSNTICKATCVRIKTLYQRNWVCARLGVKWDDQWQGMEQWEEGESTIIKNNGQYQIKWRESWVNSTKTREKTRQPTLSLSIHYCTGSST